METNNFFDPANIVIGYLASSKSMDPTVIAARNIFQAAGQNFTNITGKADSIFVAKVFSSEAAKLTPDLLKDLSQGIRFNEVQKVMASREEQAVIARMASSAPAYNQIEIFDITQELNAKLASANSKAQDAQTIAKGETKTQSELASVLNHFGKSAVDRQVSNQTSESNNQSKGFKI